MDKFLLSFAMFWANRYFIETFNLAGDDSWRESQAVI
jgi:hypothetical protein